MPSLKLGLGWILVIVHTAGHVVWWSNVVRVGDGDKIITFIVAYYEKRKAWGLLSKGVSALAQSCTFLPLLKFVF